jgi:protein SCO1/2
MNLRWILGGLIAVTTLLLVTVVVLRWQLGRQAALPVIGEVPAFTLTDARGQEISRDDLKGDIWVADFIFTRCASICPIMSTRMATLPQDELRLVSFSVDPEYDTPPVLKEYGSRYDAKPDRWSFLTGDRQAIRDLAINGFHLGVADGTEEDGELIVHSSRFVLIDQQARIRGYYDGLDTNEVRRLLVDARRLASWLN